MTLTPNVVKSSTMAPTSVSGAPLSGSASTSLLVSRGRERGRERRARAGGGRSQGGEPIEVQRRVRHRAEGDRNVDLADTGSADPRHLHRVAPADAAAGALIVDRALVLIGAVEALGQRHAVAPQTGRADGTAVRTPRIAASAIRPQPTCFQDAHSGVGSDCRAILADRAEPDAHELLEIVIERPQLEAGASTDQSSSKARPRGESR